MENYIVGKAPSEASSKFTVDASLSHRPVSVSAPMFQRRRTGGGGGAGGGRNGLGGRHACKHAADVLPRSMQGIGDQAARAVASHPPKQKPPKACAFQERAAGRTLFRTMYHRGDLPLRVDGGVQKYVRWSIPDNRAGEENNSRQPKRLSSSDYEASKLRFLATLDYSVMLVRCVNERLPCCPKRLIDLTNAPLHVTQPLFFDGLREKADPCRFLAAQGLKDLLAHGDAARVGPVLPHIVLPLRQALNTRDPETVSRTIVAIRQVHAAARARAVACYLRLVLS